VNLAVVAVELVINARGAASIVNAGVPYDVLERAVPIHPTVSELIPTMLGEMRPAQ
jgi:hypothetical protein